MVILPLPPPPPPETAGAGARLVPVITTAVMSSGTTMTGAGAKELAVASTDVTFPGVLVVATFNANATP
jgi:hypothetical protein